MLLGKDRDDPWDPDRLVWPLLDVIDDSLDEAWCATLATHLGHGVDGEEGLLRRSRRYSVARRLAGLFAGVRRAAARPGDATGARAATPTAPGEPVDVDLAWQPELWRRLVERRRRRATRRAACRDAGAAARRAATGSTCRRGCRCSGTPGCRSPRSSCWVRSGELRDVHLWLPQVSEPLWDALARPVRGGTGAAVGRPVDPDGGSSAARARWGGTRGSCSGRWRRPWSTSLEARSLRRRRGRPARCWAGCRRTCARNAEPDAATRRPGSLDADDRSVQVHACHGATRQVDVLREVLVGLLQDDPTLEPRDILVMCPDIEAYAPLIQAGFGLADLPGAQDGHPGHRLRLRLADRALSSTNPLLALAASLVELAGGRVTATEVLDLASRRARATPLRLHRRRPRPARPVGRAGRDPLGPRRRPPRAVRAVAVRQHLGVRARAGSCSASTMTGDEHRYVADALPLDDVSSNDIDLVGRFTRVRRPAAPVRRRGRARPPPSAQWVDRPDRGRRPARRRVVRGTHGSRPSSTASWPGSTSRRGGVERRRRRTRR